MNALAHAHAQRTKPTYPYRHFFLNINPEACLNWATMFLYWAPGPILEHWLSQYRNTYITLQDGPVQKIGQREQLTRHTHRTTTRLSTSSDNNHQNMCQITGFIRYLVFDNQYTQSYQKRLSWELFTYLC